MIIAVGCDCGERFGAHVTFANKRLKCPGCGRGVVVPPVLDALFADNLPGGPARAGQAIPGVDGFVSGWTPPQIGHRLGRLISGMLAPRRAG